MEAQSNEYEIMSPVGSYESLMAAIQAGAGSVYFGIGSLNMRSGSSVNFSIDDLENIAEICRENHVQSYLTLNTIVFDQDLDLMQGIVTKAKQSGVSAIIASDMAVILFARQIQMEVHISTQLNITNFSSIKYYAQFADVIVTARELKLDQIKSITDQIHEFDIRGPSGKLLRIEIFVHGALCMAVSGKCYLSLHEKGNSANRGACLQTCRKAYLVTEKETGYQLEIDNEYIMSPKDLCTIRFFDKVVESGAKVFKIEGRARPPEYVKIVTQCYKEALNSAIQGDFSKEKVLAWEQKMKTVFNRGFWDGYYLGQPLGEWNDEYGSKSTKMKVYVGKITNYFSKIGIAEIKIESDELNLQDEILIIGPTTGVYEDQVKELRVDLLNSQKAIKGQLVSMPVTNIVRRSDKVYKLIDRK